MKSVLLSIVTLFATVTSVVAQFSLGAHVLPAVPLSDFSNEVQTGFGFNIEGRFQLSEPWRLVLALA